MIRAVITASSLALAAATAAPPVHAQCNPWEVVPSPNAPGAQRTYLRAIHAVSENNIWAVGESTTPTGLIRPFSMRWDGASWTIVPVPVPNPDVSDAGLRTIAGIGPDHLWAAGHREFTPSIPFAFFGTHIAVWRWAGSQWELMQTPQLGGGSGDMVWGVTVLAPNDVWFVGDGHPQPNAPQPALAMRWDGSAFHVTNVPIVNFNSGRRAGNPLFDISAISPTDMWAVGGSNAAAVGSYSQIHHWNGSTWTHRPGPTPGYFNQLFTVVALASDNVWAAGEYWDASGIYPFLIRWNGSTWTQVPSPGAIRDMVALAPNNIWAVGDAIYRFDGQSWSLVQTIDVPAFTLAGITAVENCRLWAAGTQSPGPNAYASLVVRVNGGADTPSCPADWNGDGAVNSQDISSFIAGWLADIQNGTLLADWNGDGAVNSADISSFITAWLQAVSSGC